MENKDNAKNLWKILKRIAPTRLTSQSPMHIVADGAQKTKPEGIANAFNNYFTSLTTPPTITEENRMTTLSELDNLLQEFIDRQSNSTPKPYAIPPITKETIELDIKKIPSNKATGLDGINI